MTKLRAPLSLEDGLNRAIGLLNMRPAAELIQRRPGTLRAYSDEDDERQLGIKDALALDQACKRAGHGAPIFEAYALQLDVSAGGPGHCPAELARRLAKYCKEHGQAIAALIPAISTSAAPADLAFATRELRDAIAEAQAMLPMLEAVTSTRAPP